MSHAQHVVLVDSLRHDLELAVGAILVAGIAVDDRVGTGQGEAVVVLLYVLNGDRPSADGMALLAIGTQLALVNISVAVLAALTDAGEDHFDVTLGAGDGRVNAAQRIPCLIMVELRNSANRFPATRGMTILAGKGETAVRTMRAFRDLRTRSSPESGESENQDENCFQFRYDPSAHDLPLAFVL